MNTDNDENFAKEFESQLKLADIEKDEKFAKELDKKFMDMTINSYRKTKKNDIYMH